MKRNREIHQNGAVGKVGVVAIRGGGIWAHNDGIADRSAHRDDDDSRKKEKSDETADKTADNEDHHSANEEIALVVARFKAIIAKNLLRTQPSIFEILRMYPIFL